MAFQWLGSLWATPQQPAARPLVPSTSPLAGLSRAEQRDRLLEQLAELQSSDEEEEYEPQKRPRFTQPEEDEDSSEDFALDEPPAEPRRRPPTNWDKVPKDRTITVDGNSIDDPAVKSVLKKQFSKDNAGYTPYQYWPSKTNALRVWVKCLLHKGGCPKRCRIDFANGKATIRVGDHDHEHPDRDSDELLNPKRGLGKVIKGLIDEHCEKVGWCITDIMKFLKEKKALGNYDENPDYFLDKIKGYVKRKYDV